MGVERIITNIKIDYRLDKKSSMKIKLTLLKKRGRTMFEERKYWYFQLIEIMIWDKSWHSRAFNGEKVS